MQLNKVKPEKCQPCGKFIRKFLFFLLWPRGIIVCSTAFLNCWSLSVSQSQLLLKLPYINSRSNRQKSLIGKSKSWIQLIAKFFLSQCLHYVFQVCLLIHSCLSLTLSIFLILTTHSGLYLCRVRLIHASIFNYHQKKSERLALRIILSTHNCKL